MTNLKRIAVSLTPEQEAALVELRKSDKYCMCSMSEIVRKMFDAGIRIEAENRDTDKSA